MTKSASVSFFTLEEIEIRVERKSIRNMYIRICPPHGDVRISAPRSMPQYRIEAFAQQRLSWIKKNKAKYTTPPELSFSDGERLFLWGKAYSVILKISDGKQSISVDEQNMSVIFSVHGNCALEDKQKLWEAYCRESLSIAVPEALDRCERIVGTKANEWHIKKMKTRWGSCNYIERRIWLNAALSGKAPECLDYVLIHELVHLYEIKHNARFKSFMDTFYPNWREVKRMLNEKQV